jgi:6-phosphofructo-2-kinase / fructose-2,6-biphosphatase 4
MHPKKNVNSCIRFFTSTRDSGGALSRRPELWDVIAIQEGFGTDDDASTAEIAANAPRYRRKSSTFIDGIHDVPEDQDMAPAQLYSTMSGRLFHSGRIAIVMVGLPARGKT